MENSESYSIKYLIKSWRLLFSKLSFSTKIYFIVCLVTSISLAYIEFIFLESLLNTQTIFQGNYDQSLLIYILFLSTILFLLRNIQQGFSYKFGAKAGNDLTYKLINCHYKQDYFYYKYMQKIDLIQTYTHNIRILVKTLLQFNQAISALIIMFALCLSIISNLNLLQSFSFLILISGSFLLPQLFIYPILKYFNKLTIEFYSNSISTIRIIENKLGFDRISNSERKQLKEIVYFDQKYRNSEETGAFFSSIPRVFTEYIVISLPILIYILFNVFLNIEKINLSFLLSNLLALGYSIQRLIPLSTLVGNFISGLTNSRKEVIQFTRIFRQKKNYYFSEKHIENNNLIYHGSNYYKNISFRTKNLNYYSGINQVLKINNLSLIKGDILLITGESGKGKSSLIDTLSGLIKPVSGSISLEVAENIISNADYINHVSYLFQNPTFSNNLTKSEFKKWMYYSKLLNVKDCLEKYLSLSTLKAIEISLSGGQKQRLALANIFSFQRAIYFLDEPTSALDEDNEKLVINLIKLISQKSIVIIVSHSKKLRDISTKNIILN